MTVYRCGNKRCRDYYKEFEAMDIEGVRQATGGRVHCNRCGDIAWFVRKVKSELEEIPRRVYPNPDSFV